MIVVLNERFKNVLGLIVICLICFQSCKEETLQTLKINADWKFKKIETSIDSEANWHLTTFNDSGWEAVSLPHTANIEPQTVNNQWQGICWYRKTFHIPKGNIDKKMFLELEAAMNYSKIWINGEEVSKHHGGYLPVVVDVTKYVTSGDENVIAIRLDNTDNKITGPKPLKRLDFNMYGGLYRNAWFTVKEKVYISHPVLANKVAGGGIFITYPKVSKDESIVKVKTHLTNDFKEEKAIELVQKIYKNGTLVEEHSSSNITIHGEKDIELTEEFSIQNASLWSPRDPNLYTLKTQLVLNGEVIDEDTTRFGIREFTFQDNELYINGEKTFLRGVNRHQEYPFIGYALSDNAQYRDAKKIKDAGFNYIRLSHYPQSPAFMDACDELGLVVIDAIMGWQFYNDTDSFRDYCYRSATELIRRDRNRPSVLAWEVSLNETQMPIFFMEELDRIVHAEYPGDNVYSCGWKDDVYNIYLQARQHRILHPHELKDKPYSVSEYGDWEYHSKNAGLNQDKLPNDLRAELSSRQARAYGEERLLNQAYNVQEAHNDNLNTVAYSDSYWVMYDYNRGYHDDIEYSGLMDLFRLPKFAYYFYKSQQDVSKGYMLKLATYWNEKSPKDIRVFSNADEVKLYLNNTLVASQKPDSGKNTDKIKHPPFTFKIKEFKPGTLKAVGFVDGKKVAEDIVITPKKATAIKLWLDESGKAPETNQNDVLFLYAAAVDENGTIIPDYSETVNFDISGDVSILNPDEIKAEAGIATALIKVGDSEGTINIKTTSGKLSGFLKFEVQ
ncbi:glycoside hydrolase family 2 TIM barrel-domain containing protein [Seonamhaeicola marinus]|uniref:Glycoside hydrolase family 2 protein n=1 Tax=Seonamhaeicola marinus TaxID=1912246 RepID=A0A5D0HN03_9FLAO|nr:glycoside hydrolase family 2 TIM barrel-domain containing protein [Seonamhaeicola marinus]TYA71729.1 glycoside hydrolase family 2 protein [Seonamhaeicola marinus]